MPRRVLVIEDDQDLASLLEMHLEEVPCDVTVEHDGDRGLREALTGSYDLLVLDRALPGIEGLDICREVRARQRRTGILMLTARSTEIDRIVGLEVGADDYITKPFSVLELVARVKALLRRLDAQAPPADEAAERPLRHGTLEIDPRRRTVTVGGRSVDLTAKEFDLLLEFARHPGRVFTRSQLLDQVWGYSHGGYEHTVNSHINRLRSKIEEDSSDPRYILTVWGVGYKFADSLEE
jgi:DNA-binding response OmpR family regulator